MTVTLQYMTHHHEFLHLIMQHRLCVYFMSFHHTDPIHNSKAETDASYHKNMEHLMSLDDTFLCVASHNSDTVCTAKDK